MATRSTIPTVRARLASLLAAQAGLSGIQVSPSNPGAAVQTNSVWIGEARGTGDVPVSRAGRLKRDEKYTIDVWCAAIASGPDVTTAETTAFGYYGEVEDLLATNTTLDDGTGAACIRAFVAVFEEQLALADNGFLVQVKAEVEVEARLS